MEVHKHPHHIMHKKKWLEYLLEFTMLFMAVFLGFLAENIREHRVEKERGKEYVRSIINDLKADTTLLGRNIINIEARLKSQKAVIDSFYLIEKGYNKTFFENLNSFKGFPDFIYSDATIQQLKYSGGFRLIKKQAIVDSIMTYDSEVRRSMINASDLGKNLLNLHNYSDQIYNYQGLDQQMKQFKKTAAELEYEQFDFLITHDKITLTKFYNQLRYFSWLLKIVQGEEIVLHKKAKSLIRFLRKEYHMDWE